MPLERGQMELEDGRRIRKNIVNLKTVDPKILVDYFMQEELFDFSDIESIISSKSVADRWWSFESLLFNCGPRAYDTLLMALEAKHYTDLVRQIRTTKLAKQCVDAENRDSNLEILQSELVQKNIKIKEPKDELEKVKLQKCASTSEKSYSSYMGNLPTPSPNVETSLQPFEMNEYVFVVAIDLGTTYSNWAYSFIGDYKNDPARIFCPIWNQREYSSISWKAPTTILVREDGKTLDSFGYEAEDKYEQFEVDDIKLRTWYYFNRFKMLLYDRKIRREMTLESQNGKVLPAIRVFALTIEYLMKDCLNRIDQRLVDKIDRSLIRWVLTVPAIWDEPAKQFMREAAVQAGIPSSHLILAFEPEAASLYCTKITVQNELCNEKCWLDEGTTFMLIDAGSGTINITAHEVMSDRSLKEIYRSNGGAWAGTEVDKAFFNFLNDNFGKSVMETLKQKHMRDYLELCRDFEHKKRSITPKSISKVCIYLPTSLNELFKKQNEQDLTSSLKAREKWSSSVNIMNDKMRMDADIMKGFFADVLEKTRNHLKLLFSCDSLLNVENIIMVGEFSESKMLNGIVQETFPNKKVIVPMQPDLAVLKGAVLFGHEPAVVGYRICKFSYGVKTSVKFVKGEHREDKKITVGKVDLCTDKFDIHVFQGQSVKVNEKQNPITYKPQKPGQKNISFELYASNDRNPMYVTDEGCIKMGKITVDVLDDSRADNAVEVSFKFGGTEIQVEAKDRKTGKATNTYIDLI